MGNTIAKKYQIRWPPYSGSQFVYTLEEYRAKFEEYLIYCLDESRQPFLMDFASFCGITDQTARNYAKRGDTEEEKAAWQELHALIVQYTEVEMWQAMLAGTVKERAASMFLINFNKRVANRTISDNKTELEVKGSGGTTLATVLDQADAGGLTRSRGTVIDSETEPDTSA